MIGSIRQTFNNFLNSQKEICELKEDYKLQVFAPRFIKMINECRSLEDTFEVLDFYIKTANQIYARHLLQVVSSQANLRLY